MAAADPGHVRLLAEALRNQGWGRIPLRGDSMLPTLREGWKLHVRSVSPSELRVGDIGAFIHHDVLTIHRLIWKRVDKGRPKFIFQGDNNPVRETVDGESILGRVEAAEGEWCEGRTPRPLPIGNDERAFFYRNAFRFHALVSRYVPSVRVPEGSAPTGLPYRCLRGCFRVLELVFAPRRSR